MKTNAVFPQDYFLSFLFIFKIISCFPVVYEGIL